MRTLLIDNYDSFTYNLHQLLGEVNGVPPVVLRNDAVTDLAELELERFDNIVISPGPGRPDVVRDVGISAAVIRDSALPLLGVCLGHQGIVVDAGGVVAAAPVPRHGYPDRVSHDGEGLFAGLPADFTAVRYHSLVAREPLPGSLRVTARSGDGVVMGVRRLDRPQWGVQFHPESVSSEFGAALLRNFAELTRRARVSGGAGAIRSRTGAGPLPGSRAPLNGAAARPGTGAPVNGARGATERPAAPPRRDGAPQRPRYRLRHTAIPRAIDTEAIFLRLYADSPTAFWLDSEHVEPGLDRFSFLGDASGPLAEVVRYRVGAGAVRVESAGGVRYVPGSVLEYLASELRRRSDVRRPPLPFDFACGYVGYLGYEMKAECGGNAAHTAETPDAQWIFADRMVVVDHVAARTHLLALDDGSDDVSSAWLAATEAALTELPTWSNPAPLNVPADPAAIAPLLGRGRDRYLADIAVCLQRLRAGESYEICLTDAARVPDDRDGLALYRTLRRCNPAPYAAYLRFGELDIACSSPERFLRIDRTGTVESKPIKGTAPRGATQAEDDLLRRELAGDPKTRAENLMIVDLLRNDLGRVCEIGSVHVPELMAVESYSTLHQLVSTVRGTLRPDAGPVDVLRACFPGGSMTGAPKLRTMEIIDELETEPRGVYSGTIGYLDVSGTADLNIVIRTAVRSGGGWRIGAGGAIVLGSDPAAEYLEMVLKAAATYRALAPAPVRG
ncbi:aminodeoxychorismate synthase component I [Nocardia asteroides]|uniref:aminodeoxychorismate synthase component I n=1 Tax=Nocardia asteroides TaxID=1824 RepID=UPI001E2D2C32|nr:aminodeoxychorismate synthase component I [Nocardia asteroides]UGT60575.1 aminodeoxychorismate synthase component I [Nocardia asteroides]